MRIKSLGPASPTQLDVLTLIGQPIRADAGPDRTVECVSSGGTPVTLDGSASLGPDLKYRWSAPGVTFDNPAAVKPTGLFPSGTTTVTLEITCSGTTITDQALVTVSDNAAPTLALTASPAVLWPPNHALTNVAVAAEAHDGCDPSPAVRLLSVTSSEPDAGTEAEDVPADIVGAEPGTDDLTLALRAERLGSGPGRTYEACYEARDAAGNAAVACVTISVPHDQGQMAKLPGRLETPPAAMLAGPAGAGALVFAAGLRPNPAPRQAAITLTLPQSGVVRVTIFDVAGHVIARPVDGWRPAGQRTEPLGPLPGPQVYWYRVEWQGRHLEGKFVTLR